MIKIIISIVISINLFCLTFAQDTIVGRWQPVDFDNTLYEFIDTELFADAGLRYTIYSLDGNFGGIDDAISNPNPYLIEGNTLSIDLFFGNIATYRIGYRCDGQVVDFYYDDIIWDEGLHSTMYREGFDYDGECDDNSPNLEFRDFIGTWNGNITNDQTWSYDDPISIDIEPNGGYTVTNNPGQHLVSDLYPGTEEVLYNISTNILTFRWVQYYHYSCGGACYSGVYFQVMEFGDGEMTLFYNNGSGPAPQANSMFLSLDDWLPDLPGDVNQDDSINVLDVVLLVNSILNEDSANDYPQADLNEDGLLNVLDVVLIVNIILN